MWPCPRRWPSRESARSSSGVCLGLGLRRPDGRPSTPRRWRASASSGARPVLAASTIQAGT
eukprot:5953886-Alexandrium_andersonii.AAC.1